MAFVYILYSKQLNRYYTGSTSGTIEGRIDKHLNKIYGKKAFSAKTAYWVLFWSVYTDSMVHARKMESKLKKMKSKVYLQNLVKYPELVNKIFEETK